MEVVFNKWDEEILRDLCNDRDRELILSVPLSMTNKEDDWFWLLDLKGMFFVRSSYMQLQGEYPKPHAIFWRRVWNLQLSGKVLNLLWRACCACLPTTMVLANKRVPISTCTTCPWCLHKAETNIHVLFDCNFARSIWFDFGLQHLITLSLNDTVFDVLVQSFASLPLEKCALVGLWVWDRRNKLVWNKFNRLVFGVKAAALNMLKDLKDAKEKIIQQPHVHGLQRTEASKWCKPSPGWVKINIDASIFEETRSVGQGCVVRGEPGEILMAHSYNYRGLFTPREAEAMILKEAIY